MTASSQHAGLSQARWAEFSFDQQILMIGNELNRASHLLDQAEWDHVRRGYERVLRLTDLTIAGATSRTRRRELLRWRDLVAALYLEPQPDADVHRRVFRCLLQFTPIAFRQADLLLGSLRVAAARCVDGRA